MVKVVTILLMFSLYNATNAQSLYEYRWKNRVMIINTPNENHPYFLKQLSELKGAQLEMEERKLISFVVLKDRLHLLDYINGSLDPLPISVEKFLGIKKNPQDKFQIMLIGLDGGEKMNINEVLPVEVLFSTIDGMPMRKEELRKRGN